jgi:glycosyltransferase involved in cell wall biosynthesis
MAAATEPALSVVMPTFNNERVLRRAIDSWRRFGGDAIEVIVIEDGCRDVTADYLRAEAQTSWGRAHLRWFHEDDAHELRCTNRGIAEARGALIAAFQDDMFLQGSWLVPELLSTFATYADLGLLCLSRGLMCMPCEDPIERWEDLWDPKRLPSTIGVGLLNWIRLQEVDVVIRPWVVRRACLDRVGMLDEAFRPTEWDEADLAYRIRDAGWKVATHGYERLGAYFHLGSTTVGVPSNAYCQRVLKNGRLFHERWDATIARDAERPRRTWPRTATAGGWMATASAMMRAGASRRVARARAASEPRERREPAKRRTSERVGESEGRSPSVEQ